MHCVFRLYNPLSINNAKTVAFNICENREPSYVMYVMYVMYVCMYVCNVCM
jgi:hypothetical protein